MRLALEDATHASLMRPPAVASAALPALELRVRVPGWAAPGSLVRVVRGAEVTSAVTPANGTFHAVRAPEGGWKGGDVVELALGMLPRLEAINDERAEYASVGSIMLGPLLLAGITNESDLIRADPSRVADWVVPRPVPCKGDSYRRGDSSRRPWSVWAQATRGRCEHTNVDRAEIELVAVGANRNYSPLPLSAVALQNYTAFFNVTMCVSASHVST